MKAVLLAAGVGSRLGAEEAWPPKALLRFGGKTLLQRHVEILRHGGVDELVVATGYKADLVEAELGRLCVEGFARTCRNPDYREGSVVTLWTVGDAVAGGGEVFLMDADVLYDYRLFARLRDSRYENCFLLDRRIEGGEEPVRLCIRRGHPVDFRKSATTPCDYYGESVGFFRFSSRIAEEVVRAAGRYVAEGRREEPYEEAIRDVLLGAPVGRFGFEDVTGLPWIEIDFAEDIRRAERDIVSRLREAVA